MAKKIQMWASIGPRLAVTDPVLPEEVIDMLVQNTNQTRGSILAVLSELDEIILMGLRQGKIVQLPNGTHYQPIGKKDGTVNIRVRTNPRVKKLVNAEFRGHWLHSENINKTEAEMIAVWNAEHPDDPIEI